MKFLPSYAELFSEGWKWYHDDCSLYFPGTEGFIDCSLITLLGRPVWEVSEKSLAEFMKGYKGKITTKVSKNG